MIKVKLSWKCNGTRLLLICRRNQYNFYVSLFLSVFNLIRCTQNPSQTLTKETVRKSLKRPTQFNPLCFYHLHVPLSRVLLTYECLSSSKDWFLFYTNVGWSSVVCSCSRVWNLSSWWWKTSWIGIGSLLFVFVPCYLTY